MKGTVKFFNADKHFGFIAGEDGKEYFVHSSGIEEGVTIRDDDAVEFELVEGDRGMKADKVKLAGAAETTEDAAEKPDEPEKAA